MVHLKFCTNDPRDNGAAEWHKWKLRKCCRVGVRGLCGSEGTWQEVVGFVSSMLGYRMCIREVMDYPWGERPLIYALWTWLRPGSRPADLQMGPMGHWRDAKKTITTEVTRRHSLPLSFSQCLCPMQASHSFYPLRPPQTPLSIELQYTLPLYRLSMLPAISFRRWGLIRLQEDKPGFHSSQRWRRL